MKWSYKNYKIEAVVRIETGLWKAWANIIPALKIDGDLSKGGFATREEAEAAVWKVAKELIDQATEGDKRP